MLRPGSKGRQDLEGPAMRDTNAAVILNFDYNLKEYVIFQIFHLCTGLHGSF